MKNPIQTNHLKNQLNRSAQSYSDNASWLKEMVDEQLDRLEAIRFKPTRILDLGGADGYAADRLKKRFPKAELVNLDIAIERLKLANHTTGLFKKPAYDNVCADMQNLPFAKNSFDMVFANASFHTCDLELLFPEMSRVLEADGLLMFSLFGPDTLIELRQAFAVLDETPHVYLFPDMHDVGDRLIKAPFKDPVMDVERVQKQFESVDALIKMLTQWGERLCHQDQTAHLTTMGQWQQVCAAYLNKDQNQVEASFEIVFGHAWGREKTQRKDADGTVYVSVESLFER